MTVPDNDYLKPGKGYYQSFAKRDLYSELISVSTPNLQKHWLFSVFYQYSHRHPWLFAIYLPSQDIKKPTH